MKRFANFTNKMLLAPDTGGTGGAVGAEASAGADDMAADDDGGTAAEGAESQKGQETNKKYDEDYIKKLQADFELKLKEERELAAAEALKKASMKPDEKAEYEQEQRLKALEDREKAAALRELQADAADALSERNISKKFLPYVLADNLENTTKRIDAFKALFDEELQAKLMTKLAGKTPPAGSAPGGTLSLEEQVKNALNG
jgi:hypothetical protein